MISAKQKKIASKAGDPNKIDAKDFAVLKAEKAKGRGMGLQDEQLPPGKMVAAKKGKMIKKAKDMSKLHENRETTMQEGKETMMESKGYKESSSGKMVKANIGMMIEDEAGMAAAGPMSPEDRMTQADIDNAEARRKPLPALQEYKRKPMTPKERREQDIAKRSQKKMGGGMIDPTMSNYQKGGSVMARGNKIARIRPTKLY
jgi:hypothetical protein